MSPADRLARARFGVLIALRLGGAVLIALGLWLSARTGLAAAWGTLALLAGVAATLVAPRLLARRWRSPR